MSPSPAVFISDAIPSPISPLMASISDDATTMMTTFPGFGGSGSRGPGAGTLLPKPLLIVCALCTLAATIVSTFSILLQLKSYRRPSLQRFVVRIMIMVPLYAMASLIALWSLDAAFFIDAVRDLYEAFVIYAFLQLLITYLGGERSLLILLHGREPIPHPFPFNLLFDPMDVSDPWVLLNLKRGVLQYVQLKPILVITTVVCKLTDTYREGKLAWDSGYTYVSVIYNTSICLSLYCLAMFWVAVSKDLQGFRPLPKFLCVKGILFFSFWQGLAVSALVAVGAIRKLGAYTDAEHMSLALTDSLLCIEMPFFAIAHQYAFHASDYIDTSLVFAARMPFYYAVKDAFGYKDVWQDVRATLKGRGISYQAYEPAEGGIHVGEGRSRRIKAGLRYSAGGKKKYWLPQPGGEGAGGRIRAPFRAIKRSLNERAALQQGYAPLLPNQRAKVFRQSSQLGGIREYDSDSDESDAPSLDFTGGDEWEEAAYTRARKIEYVGYPNVDVSKEEAKRKLWDHEQRILSGQSSGRERHSSSASQGQQENRRANNNKSSKSKFKGNGQARGVYGKWGDRDYGTLTGSTMVNSSKSSGSKIPAAGPEDDANFFFDAAANGNGEAQRVYNGDIEREERANGGSETQMRWTKRKTDKSASATTSGDDSPARRTHLTPPRSPFELGPADDVSDPEEDEPVKPKERALPHDAVDLVVEDESEVQEAADRERRKGEPAVHLPKHVYKRGWANPAGHAKDVRLEVFEDGEERIVEVDEDGLPAHRGRSESVSHGSHDPHTTFGRAPSHRLLREEQDDSNPWE